MRRPIDLPEETWKEIKVRAAQEGKTQKDLIREFLQAALSNFRYGPPDLGIQEVRDLDPWLDKKIPKPGDFWDVPEIKVEPGTAPRSTSAPKIEAKPNNFGTSRPAPKPGQPRKRR